MSVVTDMPETTNRDPVLLNVEKLSKHFPVKVGLRQSAKVLAVEGVSFAVREGETLGIVGESGCGKSTTARLMLGLIEPDAGRIMFAGRDIKTFKRREQKALRRNMQMVFQDPYSAINPRMSIRDNIGFPLKVHGYDRKAMQERTSALLEQVGLHPNYASYFSSQLSGGQLQRVNIARALALDPKLVVCDEAVSALDKSIQAQVLNLLKDLQERLKLTYVFISHDLNVVEYMSDRVLVMYMGQVVEACAADELYQNPLHPYTRTLLASTPQIEGKKRDAVEPVDGEMPSPLNPPSGCRFRTRCPFAMEICTHESPTFRHPVKHHAVACHLYERDAEPVS